MNWEDVTSITKVLNHIVKFSFYKLFSLLLCVQSLGCVWLCNPLDCSPQGSSVHEDSTGKNTGMGWHPLLQGIFPTQGSNPSLPHCRWILYCLSHQGSPRILEWVSMPSSRGSSQPRKRSGVSWIAGRFFTTWDAGEALQRSLIDVSSSAQSFSQVEMWQSTKQGSSYSPS